MQIKIRFIFTVYGYITVYEYILLSNLVYYIYIYIYINFVFFVYCNIITTHTHTGHTGFTFT